MKECGVFRRFEHAFFILTRSAFPSTGTRLGALSSLFEKHDDKSHRACDRTSHPLLIFSATGCNEIA